MEKSIFTNGGIFLEQLVPQPAALHGDLLFVPRSAGDSSLDGASPQESHSPASQGSSLTFQVCYHIKSRASAESFPLSAS